MELQKLYNHCAMTDTIENGNLFPVGGGFFGSPNTPWKVKVDFENFYDKLKTILDKNEAILEQQPARHTYFTKKCPDVDPHILQKLDCFTISFEGKRKIQTSNGWDRRETYTQAPNNTPLLSEMFSKNQAMCVEISLLAKKYLDDNGIKNTILSGEALLNDTYEVDGLNVPTPHTFLLIEDRGQEFIFDPANPNFDTNGHPVFSLRKPCTPLMGQLDRMKQDSLMIEVEDGLNKSRHYYGVNDSGSLPESFFVHFAKNETVQDDLSL